MKRSWLLLDPSDETGWSAALRSEADNLVFDLASVSPETCAAARQNAQRLAGQWHALAGAKPALYLRIHPLASGEAEADIRAAVEIAADGVIVPQIGNGAEIQKLHVILSAEEVLRGHDPEQTRIVAMAGDTYRGVLGAGSFCGKSDRLVALGWDAKALFPEAASGESALPETVRQMLAISAAACDAAAIDTLSDEKDASLFRQACETARRNGFSGKFTASVEHLAIINAVFT